MTDRVFFLDMMIENRTFQELVVGDSASSSKTATQQDIVLFALVSKDVNLAYIDPDYAATDMPHHFIPHDLLGAGLISNVLGTKLPELGTVCLGQDQRFGRPLGIGNIITATLMAKKKHADKDDIVLTVAL